MRTKVFLKAKMELTCIQTHTNGERGAIGKYWFPRVRLLIMFSGV